MTQRLAQVLATEPGSKQHGFRTLTSVYHTFKQPGHFQGMTRTYTPEDESGLERPPEFKRVQHKAEDLLELAAAAFTEIIDVEATKNYANRTAAADVELDGEVIMKDVPAETLLFLETQLKKMLDELKAMPVLDPSHEWELDSATGLHRTDAVEQLATQKLQRGLVLHPPTDKHPAQTQLITEDVTVGRWATVQHSGAVPATRRRELLQRVHKMINAIARARQEANRVEAPAQEYGEALFKRLLTT